MKIDVELIDPRAVYPVYATEGAVGADLVATGIEYKKDRGIIVYDTGIVVAIPEGYEGQIRARSNLVESSWYMPHGVGTIDQDYRGTLKVVYAPRYNDRNIYDIWLPYQLGERCAQLVISPIVKGVFETKSLEPTARQDKGFGSTGKAKLKLKIT